MLIYKYGLYLGYRYKQIDLYYRRDLNLFIQQVDVFMGRYTGRFIGLQMWM